jgi:predicted nucleic acid-binding protein
VVGSRSLDAFLKRHKSVYLDTSSFIYFVEHHPRYFPLCEKLFDSIETGKVKASTSTLTLLEVLVRPYQLGQEDLVHKFYALLTTYPHLAWVPMTLKIADHAAKLRAEHRFKTPDSIQAASAFVHGATGFVCNDKVFEKVERFEVLVIDEYISGLR